MIEKSLSFELPLPWQRKTFATSKIGYINFLVGPNGSGKSKFGQKLKEHFGSAARILGTDRLSGMEQNNSLRQMFGDHMVLGLAKSNFDSFRSAGQQGLGIDTLILLEERMDLRIQVEATLSHLFNRKISLEWDSGNLSAKAILGDTGLSYRLDREECHGIKELLVLLTHLYNDQYQYLIIDEPELNLHPQYQAFFIQEVRKVVGNPELNPEKKVVFLITHSPFILDFHSIDDVKSVISFAIDHSLPKQILEIGEEKSKKLSSLVPRLNVHHKQLFFSDNPVFVEGILDAQMVASLQEARGVSVAGSGSCIIDAGGCEEVNHYLELCLAFGKKAHFLYDLDSLFFGSLKSCIKSDEIVQSFLATSGIGNDFAKYCGELDGKLTDIIDQLLASSLPDKLSRLKEFLLSLGSDRKKWDSKNLSKARVAVLTAMSRYPDEVAIVLKETDIQEIEGRLRQITKALRERNIHLLTGGTLERYLPKYSGDDYKLEDSLKRQAVNDEIADLSDLSIGASDRELAQKYGELFDAVCRLPSKIRVDVDRVLKDYLSRYIHELQRAVANNPNWQLEQIRAHLYTSQRAAMKVFSIQNLERGENKSFKATIAVAGMLGQKPRQVCVSDKTNAGMGEFEIEAIIENAV